VSRWQHRRRLRIASRRARRCLGPAATTAYQFDNYKPLVATVAAFLSQLRDRHGHLPRTWAQGPGTTPSRGGDGPPHPQGRRSRADRPVRRCTASACPPARTLSLWNRRGPFWRAMKPLPPAVSGCRWRGTHLRFASCDGCGTGPAPATERLIAPCGGHLITRRCGSPSGRGPRRREPQLLPFLRRLVDRAAGWAPELDGAGFTHGVLNTTTVAAPRASTTGPLAFLNLGFQASPLPPISTRTPLRLRPAAADLAIRNLPGLQEPWRCCCPALKLR